jgi:pimeloyl-ACP methyl ester carboxylesterase
MDPRDAALVFLCEHGADALLHPGGTLLAHLCRTEAKLVAWGAGPALSLAGLCHAAYRTEGFPEPLIAIDRRHELAAIIGDEAEAIVYAYGSCDRGYGLPATSGHADMRDRFTSTRWTPCSEMARRLAELTAANELDVLAHASLSPAERADLATYLVGLRALLGAMAGSAVDAVTNQCSPDDELGDEDIAYRVLGAGVERIVLVHGGASPELTWARQHELGARFRLMIPWRRGFPPSRAARRQDWEQDARDLLRVIAAGSHVVAHSYGGVGALVAAAIDPSRFASLTLIESPLWSVAAGDPSVERIAALGRGFAAGQNDEGREHFLSLAALPREHPETARLERLARGFRDPGDARPPLETLATLRVFVVSGGHDEGIERVCDALARATRARRLCIRGAGHAVQRHPEFNSQLTAFLDEASAAVKA